MMETFDWNEEKKIYKIYSLKNLIDPFHFSLKKKHAEEWEKERNLISIHSSSVSSVFQPLQRLKYVYSTDTTFSLISSPFFHTLCVLFFRIDNIKYIYAPHFPHSQSIKVLFICILQTKRKVKQFFLHLVFSLLFFTKIIYFLLSMLCSCWRQKKINAHSIQSAEKNGLSQNELRAAKMYFVSCCVAIFFLLLLSFVIYFIEYNILKIKWLEISSIFYDWANL